MRLKGLKGFYHPFLLDFWKRAGTPLCMYIGDIVCTRCLGAAEWCEECMEAMQRGDVWRNYI